MKCHECKKENLELEQFGKRELCPSCLKIAKEEDKERKRLYMTICELYNIDKPTGFMFAQIKRLREKNGWYYKNMRLTLHYVVDVLKFDLDPKYGLSVVEYHYDDMLNYYKKMYKKQQASKSVQYQTKKIVTSKPDLVNDRYKQSKMKDLNKYGR